MPRLLPSTTLFPYTTLFRSLEEERHDRLAPQGGHPRNGPFADLHERVGEPHDVVDALGAEGIDNVMRSEEHTSELQSLRHLVCRLLLEKKTASLSTAIVGYA